MTLGSSESLAAPGAISSQRLAITRTYRLVDTAAATEAALAAGQVLGFAQGYPIGLDRGTSDGEAEGFADGAVFRELPVVTGYASGYADGLEAGRRAGVALALELGRSEGFASGEEVGYAAGFFAAPTPPTVTVEADPPELGTLTPDPNEAPGDPGAFSTVYGTAKDTPITIAVLDTLNVVAFVSLSALYADRSAWETIYAGRPAVDGAAGYKDGYAAFSGITGSGDPGVGFTFSVRRDDGWPGRPTLASPIKIDIQAVDAAGNVLA